MRKVDVWMLLLLLAIYVYFQGLEKMIEQHRQDAFFKAEMETWKWRASHPR